MVEDKALSFHTAAALLAAALSDRFPDAQILLKGADSLGFYCDVLFSQEFRPEFLPLLETRMKQIAQDHPEIKKMEMVPASARGLLEKQGQKVRASTLGTQKNLLLPLYQIGRWIDLCDGQLLDSLERLGAYSLTDCELLEEEGIVRIFGLAAANSQLLQGIGKQLKRYAKESHPVRGEQRGFFSVQDGQYCFFAPGLRVKEKIIRRWSQEVALHGFQEVAPTKGYEEDFPHPTAQLLRAIGSEKKFEMRYLGLFAPEEITLDQLNIPFSGSVPYDSLISSLHFARKFSRIFGFEPQWVLGRRAHASLKRAAKELFDPITYSEGDALEWTAPDRLGRQWPIGRLCIGKQAIALSLLQGVERYLALLLEKEEGRLPFWLEPVQVRIQLMRAEAEDAGAALCALVRKEGISVEVQRAHSREPLLGNPPCVIFLGDPKEEGGRLVVQLDKPGQKQRMSEEELLHYLRKKIESQ